MTSGIRLMLYIFAYGRRTEITTCDAMMKDKISGHSKGSGQNVEITFWCNSSDQHATNTTRPTAWADSLTCKTIT